MFQPSLPPSSPWTQTPSPWMPKWMAIGLGVVFGSIAIFSGVLIIQLTRAPTPVAVAAAALVAAPSAPTPAPAVATVPAPSPESAGPKPIKKTHPARRQVTGHRAVTVKGLKGTPAVASRVESKPAPRHKDELDRLLGL